MRRARCWTNACNCMAAMATCRNTTSPRCGPMPACSASMAAPRDHERADREGAVMVRAVAHMANAGCLRRGYLQQDEGAEVHPAARTGHLASGATTGLHLARP